MKSNKLKTTIRPIDERHIIIKGAAKVTRGRRGEFIEINTSWNGVGGGW